MSKRITSGLIGVVLMFAVLIFNESCLPLINLLISLISFLAMSEFLTVINLKKILCISLPVLIFVSVMPIIPCGIFQQACIYAFTLIMFGIFTFTPKIKLTDVFVPFAMALVVTVALGKIIELRDFGGKYGSFYVLLALGVAWTSDTGAYFSGKYFGKNKLCPEVSPKKTIEGFIGGIIVCGISMTIIAAIFNNFIFSQKHQINYFWIVVLGVLGAPISAFSDLCFSAIKRKFNVKDFGTLMPGHGGVLDRFDSVIFTAPFVYLFIKLVRILI